MKKQNHRNNSEDSVVRDAHASAPVRVVRAKGKFTHWDGKKASANRTGNEACSVICFFYILYSIDTSSLFLTTKMKIL